MPAPFARMIGLGLALAIAAVATSGCGRKVDLDRTAVKHVNSQDALDTDDPNTDKPAVEDRKFLLDPLL